MAATSAETSAASASADTVTLPSSLSSLSATAASSSEVDLAWTDVTGATGYEIDWKDADGNWEAIDAVDAPAATYADTGLDDGTAYTYQVIPYNGSGDADGTNPSASATTPLLAPANVAAVALSSTSIEIVWDDQSASENGFEVQRPTNGTTFTNLGSTAAGVTDYTDTTAAADTEYWYQVESTNSAAGSSAPSASAGATTPATPVSDAGPATPSLTAAAVSSSEIDITTSAPSDGSHLELEEQGPDDDNFAVVNVTPTSSDGTLTYAVTGLAPSTYYSFRLRADLNGLESYSSAADATTQDSGGSYDPSIPVPYDLTATSSSTPDSLNLQFQWDGDPADTTIRGGDDQFVDQIKILTPADPYGVLTGVWASPGQSGEAIGGSITDDGQVTANNATIAYPGFAVEVRVDASTEDGSDASAWSGWIKATVPGPLMQAPQNLTVTDAGGGQFTASWDADDDPYYSSPSNYDEGAVPAVNYALYGVDNHNVVWPVDQSDYNATSSTFTPPAPNIVKYFVVASQGEGQSGYSNYAYTPGETPTPAAPQNLSATPYSDGTSAGIRLLWDNDSDNETGFTIQRSTSADFSTDLQTFTVGADVTSYVDTTGTDDTSVQPGTTYYYQVEATNGSGETSSAFSNTASAAVTLPTVSVTAVDPDAEADDPAGQPEDGYLDFSRTGDDSSALTANVSYDGSTAVAGEDYSGTLPATVTFPAGQQSVVVPVAPAPTDPDISSFLDASVTSGSGYDAGSGEAQLDLIGEGPTVTLGDGSSNIILQGSSDGTTNLQQLSLNFPKPPPTDATLTLTLSADAASDVVLWTSDTHTTKVQFDAGSATTITWSAGANIPSTIWVGAIHGSSAVGDISFTLQESDPGAGGGPPVVSAPSTTKPATAIRIEINSDNDPNPGEPTGDITGKTRDWLVGQYAEMTATVDAPAALTAGGISYSWTVPGQAYYDYYVGPPTEIVPQDGQPIELTTRNGKLEKEIEFFWGSVSHPPDSDEVSVSATFGRSSYSASTTYNVYSPWVYSDKVVMAPPGINSAGTTMGLQAIPGLKLDGQDVGISATNSIGMPEGFVGTGTWYYVQLVLADNEVATDRNGGQHYGHWFGRSGLDNTYPYEAVSPWYPLSAGWPTSVVGTFDDDPSTPLGFWSVFQRDAIDFEAQTTIMFVPPGVGSRPVPLADMKWGYRMAVALTLQANANGLHAVDVSAPAQQPYFNPSAIYGFPTWSGVIYNGNFPRS